MHKEIVESAHHALGSGLVQVAKLVDRALHTIGCDVDATCIAPGRARLDCTADRTSAGSFRPHAFA